MAVNDQWTPTKIPGVRGTGGTLRINLKIPKEEEVKENQNYDDDNQHNFGFEVEDKGQIQKKINDSNNSIRICHVCNKGFSSGKALGGHMRIHVQASNNKEFISGKKRKRLNQPNIACYKKRKLQKHEEEDDDDEDESGGVDTLRKKKSIKNQPPITCSVCGKNFPSMKSLFGHMRCHPDRDWRGIDQPPPNNTISDHQKDSSTASIDLSKAVGGWSVTAKRGRRRNNKPIIHDYRSSEEEQQVHDVVQYLMLLAYGDSLKSGLTGSAHKQGIITEELEIMNSNSHSYKTTGTKKRTIEKTELRIEGTNNNICQMKRIKKRGRKVMKLKDLGSIQDIHQNTVFSTPEKHNEFNIAIQNSAEDSKSFVENAREYKNISITNDDTKPQLSYSSSQVSSVIRRSTSGARILDFDLNELPLPEDDDEKAAGNHGFVSYSSDFFSQL